MSNLKFLSKFGSWQEISGCATRYDFYPNYLRSDDIQHELDRTIFMQSLRAIGEDILTDPKLIISHQHEIGGIHWYAVITSPSFGQKTGDDSYGESSINMISGVRITRTLTRKEIVNDQARFRGYKAGDHYEGHNSISDAVTNAMKWARKWLPRWNIRVSTVNTKI